MEGANEEQDILTGDGLTLHTHTGKGGRPNYEKMEQRVRLLKKGVGVLVACALLLALFAFVRYRTLQECQHHLEAAAAVNSLPMPPPPSSLPSASIEDEVGLKEEDNTILE